MLEKASKKYNDFYLSNYLLSFNNKTISKDSFSILCNGK
jgi:hypothetical protein